MLAEHGVEFERRDYFKEPFTVDELRELLSQIRMAPSEVLSKRSRAYRGLGLAERDPSDEELLELMADNPTLLKRPIVVKDDNVIVGFNKDKIEAMINQ